MPRLTQLNRPATGYSHFAEIVYPPFFNPSTDYDDKDINRGEKNKLSPKRIKIDDKLEVTPKTDSIEMDEKMRDSRKKSLPGLRKIVKQKIEKIKINPIESKGLTEKEIDIAIELDLIDKDQTYLWTEEWFEDYREPQKDIDEGEFTPEFKNKLRAKLATTSKDNLLSHEELIKELEAG